MVNRCALRSSPVSLFEGASRAGWPARRPAMTRKFMAKVQSKAAAQIKALARKHSRAAIKTLAAIMNQADGPPTARVSAAQALLDRGWGKAAQPLAGDADGLPVLARIERGSIEPPKQENRNSSGEDERTHPED